MMQGLPTIVVGLFVYGLIVVPMHTESGFAGSVALSIVMLPLIARASQEVLLLVPGTLREAADALGVDRWRAVLGVILPSATGGIVTGAILAVARAAGETAPLMIRATRSSTRAPRQLNLLATASRTSRSTSTPHQTPRNAPGSRAPGARPRAADVHPAGQHRRPGTGSQRGRASDETARPERSGRSWRFERPTADPDPDRSAAVRGRGCRWETAVNRDGSPRASAGTSNASASSGARRCSTCSDVSVYYGDRTGARRTSR